MLRARNRAEIELAEALACGFQQPHPVTRAECAHWDDDYAAALRRVHFAHPDDLDVAALLVEALITRAPRRLWDVRTGSWAPHPAILHLHIHIMEMSNDPDRAMRSADLLGGLCPDAGHLNHTPSHIYALCGAYDRARTASGKAIAADDTFADYDRGLTARFP